MSELIRIPHVIIKGVIEANKNQSDAFIGESDEYRKVGVCEWVYSEKLTTKIWIDAYIKNCNKKHSRATDDIYCGCGNKIKLVDSE